MEGNTNLGKCYRVDLNPLFCVSVMFIRPPIVAFHSTIICIEFSHWNSSNLCHLIHRRRHLFWRWFCFLHRTRGAFRFFWSVFPGLVSTDLHRTGTSHGYCLPKTCMPLIRNYRISFASFTESTWIFNLRSSVNQLQSYLFSRGLNKWLSETGILFVSHQNLLDACLLHIMYSRLVK